MPCASSGYDLAMVAIAVAFLIVAVVLFVLAAAWRTMPDRLCLLAAGLASLALAQLLPALASVTG